MGLGYNLNSNEPDKNAEMTPVFKMIKQPGYIPYLFVNYLEPFEYNLKQCTTFRQICK